MQAPKLLIPGMTLTPQDQKPTARAVQELVQAWKLLRKWRFWIARSNVDGWSLSVIAFYERVIKVKADVAAYL